MIEALFFIGYLFAGMMAGVLSGLLGVGGGVIIVPALTALFVWQNFPSQHLMHLAIGTSLATMIFTTAMATWSYHKRGAVAWSMLRLLLPGMVGGSFCGVWFGRMISSNGLRVAFAIFTFILGVRLIWTSHQVSHNILKHRPIILLFCAFGVGILAGMLGIGGGILLVPLLLWVGLSMPQASATSAACAFPTACGGAFMAMIVGWHTVGLPTFTWGYVYWPAVVILAAGSIVGAPMGVALAYHLPVKIIKRIFGGLLLFIAWRMMPFSLLS